ncbi:hypothetical protein [Streptomyces sp. P17]|uniref:hypothetical protein n=1 Tax=Streptomyces sp. P17 TaxID=3074716 RepID=UPI0028F41F22|nr:hypothetical protein [Streptomyces sp. P17]MDT9698863.1 hypothetical protein [Streptomyces sp. P17]
MGAWSAGADDGATDLVVYAHGWRTPPEDAHAMAAGLLALAAEQYARRQALHPRLPEGRPWPVLLCRASGKRRGMGEYFKMRDRAHT